MSYAPVQFPTSTITGAQPNGSKGAIMCQIACHEKDTRDSLDLFVTIIPDRSHIMRRLAEVEPIKKEIIKLIYLSISDLRGQSITRGMFLKKLEMLTTNLLIGGSIDLFDQLTLMMCWDQYLDAIVTEESPTVTGCTRLKRLLGLIKMRGQMSPHTISSES